MPSSSKTFDVQEKSNNSWYKKGLSVSWTLNNEYQLYMNSLCHLYMANK